MKANAVRWALVTFAACVACTALAVSIQETYLRYALPTLLAGFLSMFGMFAVDEEK